NCTSASRDSFDDIVSLSPRRDPTPYHDEPRCKTSRPIAFMRGIRFADRCFGDRNSCRPIVQPGLSHTAMTNLRTIDRNRLATALAAERQRFITEPPRSRALFEEAKSSLFDGVPMNWMIRWPGDFPLFIEKGSGARFTDVDGREYIDFCLGDTGAMT